MIEEGATRRDIEEETGLSRFKLKRLVDRANQERTKKIRLPDARRKGGEE